MSTAMPSIILGSPCAGKLNKECLQIQLGLIVSSQHPGLQQGLKLTLMQSGARAENQVILT